ncbi:protein NRT1/ PTR FAMILY 1.1-like [Miscanthus floridulus]|uniref:protein NRT1/ PTR FAMILY 1.1-like n=1 Tax=Miscanthus floridulus TaxID=154761 RepID=UPI00345799B7
MSLGSGGIWPYTLAFGADQLDKRDNSAKNMRTLQTFFNWYYTVLGLSIVFTATVIMYIQQARGWVVDFAVPVVLMVGKMEIPATSFNVFAILTLTVWVAVYDRVLMRPLSWLTGHTCGLSLRQRMGVGLALFAVGMAVAAHTESVRRAAAIAQELRDPGHPDESVHMSAMKLVPQHCLTGLAEGLNLIGQIEFYNSEFPNTMSSIGVSLLALSLGFGAVLGSAIVGAAAPQARGRAATAGV